MNIVGESFPQPIVDQINTRQKKKGTPNRDPELLTWMNSNTGWVRLISSVDVDPTRYAFKNAPLQNAQLINSDLARQYILFGGVSDGIGKAGLRSGIATDKSIHNNNAYGLGGSEEFGLVPMPGITSFNIKTENKGSLKTATIGIKAYNRTQFDIINTLYLSLGYSVLIEWGNTMYYDNDINKPLETNNPYNLVEEFLGLNKLKGVYKWDAILPKIQEYRLKSCGNYDAALGKVVNFSWTLDRDLSYNITLTVRTIGDIIESLKVNILTGNIKLQITPPKSTSTTPTEQNPVANFANSSDIGTMMYNIQLDLDKKSDSNTPTGVSVLKFTKITQAIKQTYDETKNGNQYYIRLGWFLEILQNSIIPDVKNGNVNTKYITFDTDIESNLISLYSRQLSADPSVCLFNTKYTLNNGEQVEILNYGEQFKFYDPDIKCYYGKFMNVYFNMNYIVSSLTKLIDNEGKIILIDFLKQLSSDFCKVTGNYNKIEPTINEEINKIVFVDDVPIPGYETLLKKINPTGSFNDAFFVLYGFNKATNNNLAGIVRDLSLTTTITPQLASLITIGAQANGYITGQDSTSLSTINRGLTDRVKQEIIDPISSSDFDINKILGLSGTGLTINATTPPPSLETKYVNQIGIFNTFITTLGSINGSKPKWDQNAIDNFKNINTQFAEYDQYAQTRNAQLNNPSGYIGSPTIGFLPFGLTLTIDGLSGMKVYQKYTMDTHFLPSNYPESLEFLINGITHEIKDNQWITTIESFAVPKNPFGTQDTPITSDGRVQGVSPIVRGNNYPAANSKQYSNIKFQNIGQGNPSDDKINPTILSDINKAAKNTGIVVSVTTAVSGHHDNPPSRHSSGNAVDIALIDGIPVSPNASNRAKIDTFVNALQSIGYSKNLENGTLKSVLTFGFPNHNNHIHVSSQV